MQKLIFIILGILITGIFFGESKVLLVSHEGKEINEYVNSMDSSEIRGKNGVYKRNDVRKILFEEEKIQRKEILTEKSPVSKEKLIEDAKKATAQFPDAGYISLIDKTVQEYLSNTENTSDYHGAYIILKDDFKSLARIAHWVNDSRMEFKLRFGRIIYPDGSEFYMNPKDMVKSVPKDQGAAFFSTSGAVLYYNFPKASAGCIVEYAYQVREFLPYIDDMFDGRAVFSSQQPSMSSIIQVVLPKGKQLYHVTRNMEPSEGDPVVSEKDGKTSYLWNIGVQPPIVPEKLMPDMWDAGKVLYYSNQEKLDFLFEWRRKILAKNMTVTPYIEDELQKILAGVSDEPEEIVRNLYHFTQREIRYVSIKSGSMSGMAGHPAEETLKNRFGDCIDKSVLFSTLLKAKGINAYPLSIKTNPNGEMETRLPLFDANHSITEVHINGKELILDTTSTNHSYPYFRQDDHGVPVYNAILGKVYRSPVPAPEDNISDYSREIKFDPYGKAEVDFIGKYNGNRAAGLRGYYKTVADKDLPRIFENMVKDDATDAVLKHHAVNNKDDLFKDISIEYGYTSKEFLKKAGNLLILKNISKLPFAFDEIALKERKFPIEYMTTLRRANRNVHYFPENFQVVYLPEPIEVISPFVHYKAEYKWDSQTKELIFQDLFDRKNRIVPVDQYQGYKETIQEILNYQKKNVLLKKEQPREYVDLLILRDGDEITGALIKQEKNLLSFENTKGEVKNYPVGDVLSIELGQNLGGNQSTLSEILDPDLTKALKKDVSGIISGALKVILMDKHSYRLNDDGTYTYTQRVITRVLSEKGKNAGFDNWNFDPESEKINIDHARTINGESVTSLSSRIVKVAMAYSQYPEYQRIKNMKFALPEVKKNSILDYQITRTVKKSPLMHPFIAGLYRKSAGDSFTLDAGHNTSWNSPAAGFCPVEPMGSKELWFDVPKDTPVYLQILNDPDNLIQQKYRESGNRKVYTFLMKSPSKSLVRESYLPAITEYWPLVLIGEKVSWESIYQELKKRFVSTPQERKFCKEFLEKEFKGKKKITPEEIYNFAILQIEHLPIGLNDYKISPKPLNESLKKRKAGLIDHSWILLNLLENAGYPSEMIWIPNSSITRKVLKDFASMHYFAGNLVRFKQNGEWVYLSTGSSYLSFEDSAAHYANLEGLVISGKKWEVVTIPDKKRNLNLTKIQGKLNSKGGLENLFVEVNPQGKFQSGFRSLRSMAKKKWDVTAENYAGNIHPNTVLKNYKVSDLNDMKKPVSFEFTVNVPDYCIDAGNLILFSLPYSSKEIPNWAGPVERVVADLNLGTGSINNKEFSFEIPKEWKVYYQPKNIHLENEYILFKADISIKENHLNYKETYEIKNTQIPLEEYLSCQELLKKKADFGQEYIIFEKVKN